MTPKVQKKWCPKHCMALSVHAVHKNVFRHHFFQNAAIVGALTIPDLKTLSFGPKRSESLVKSGILAKYL